MRLLKHLWCAIKTGHKMAIRFNFGWGHRCLLCGYVWETGGPMDLDAFRLPPRPNRLPPARARRSKLYSIRAPRDDAATTRPEPERAPAEAKAPATSLPPAEESAREAGTKDPRGAA